MSIEDDLEIDETSGLTSGEELSARYQVRIDTAYPSDWSTSETALSSTAEPSVPAREYPFTLDPFQKASIAALERRESVLVSAHTSAGKTVVAEYAIAMALRDNQRVVYTSPIKALSNQKFRELQEIFGDVGLMTGDITINPNSSCLVMTTEILRSMLYRGSEVMREVAWVIFDEIHYMRDPERGVVWEETIILLPHKVRYVFLSATIPNAFEFASWIATTHSQPCHVVYTEFRPTPLQHYIFPTGGKGLHLIIDRDGQFKHENFERAIAELHQSGGKSGGGSNASRGSNLSPAEVLKIVKLIQHRHYYPLIVFSFSKKTCETLARATSKLQFNTEEEVELLEMVFENATMSLSESDKSLPQVVKILPLLRRGIGIHHSGLLPILKETIEILFQEGLVKVLFATETFAMGLNMPAKTVVFTSARKFDGRDFRWMRSGEYIQMSGRAGRRGLDDRGLVILMLDEKMEPQIAKSMLQGQPDPLNSAFHLGYNMLLNLLRVEDVSADYLIRRSFLQFQRTVNIPELRKKLAQLESQVKRITIPDEADMLRYYQLKNYLEQLKQSLKEFILLPRYVTPFLHPGRMIKMKENGRDFGWGVLLRAKNLTTSRDVVLDVLYWMVRAPKTASADAKGGSSGSAVRSETEYEILPATATTPRAQLAMVPFAISAIDEISQIRILVQQELQRVDNLKSTWRSLEQILERAKSPNNIPLLDPIRDMKISDLGFDRIVSKITTLEKELKRTRAFSASDLDARFARMHDKVTLQNELRNIKHQLNTSDKTIFGPQLKAMQRVLRRLHFTDHESVIQLKGRVACEINAANELVLTELIFNGLFSTLATEPLVALLSCFVCEESPKDASVEGLPAELAMPYQQLQETARRIAVVSQESKVPTNVDEYVGKLSPYLIPVVYAWCRGATFLEVSTMTAAFEGSIIRCMRRLEELLRQLCAAAKAIGNGDLEKKFAHGISLVKRDIVFAASLYL
jgi:ATP-dependent RNA helicase DOB1